MPRWIPWVMCLAAGCAAAPPHYGNFLHGHAEAQSVMALDCAEFVSTEWPDENGPLRLTEPPQDAFGRSLVQQLRANGLEVRIQRTASRAGRLRYAVDQLKGTALWRVTLYVGARRMSRAYQPNGGDTQPQSPWSVGPS